MGEVHSSLTLCLNETGVNFKCSFLQPHSSQIFKCFQLCLQMVCQHLIISMHPFPVTTWVPGCYRPTGLCSLSWSFNQRPAESCGKQLLGYTSLTHVSKKSCSLWNHFCNLYRKQKLCEHKASAISVTLWSVKNPHKLCLLFLHSYIHSAHRLFFASCT